METMRDSIKYIEPIYTNAQRDDFKWDLEQPEYTMDDRFDDVNRNRDVMYESTESRYATELVNVPVKNDEGEDNITFDGNKIKVAFDGGALAGNYIPKDSSLSIFVGGKKMAIAIMGGSTGAEWFGGKEIQIDNSHIIKVEGVTQDDINAEFPVFVKSEDGEYAEATLDIKKDKEGNSTDELTINGVTVRVLAVGRFDSERDLTGMHLGECELQMKTYYFQPRRISMGVTWTDMTELYLDLSFGVSAEDTLIDSVGQEIKKALDFQAVEYANRVQKVRSGNKLVKFDAEAGNTISAGVNTVIKDSYWHTAQTFTQALGHVSDEMLNIFNRGGVTAIVGGPRACRYLELIEGYSTKGAQPSIGGHQVGELNGIPVFKVPSSVIADNELLTTWKNEQAEGDVSIAIGTLVPFASTGKLPRKNFYYEQGIARYEDTQALQPRYLGRVLIENIR